MGNPRLYDYCRIGTKKVIEDFTGELLQHLRLLSSSIETIDNPVELRSHLELFKALRHTVGNSALLLSGGASLGFHHVGVIKALHEAKLLPRIITGSSSGAIVAAIACTRIDEEFEATLRWENINITLLEPTMSESFLTDAWIKLRRIFTTGAVIDIGVLRQAMRDNVGDMTFLEAYRRTQRVLNITVSTATTYEMPRLLNYITAPDVLIWSAAVASCAFPGFFHSVHLLAKDAKGNIVPWNVTEDRWIDGSVENDLPMRRLSELFNVNFFIVSQVNFHISPFLVPTVDRSPPGLIRKVVGKLAYVAYSELVFRLQQVRQLGIFPRLCHFALSILCQKYCGDVTIVPKIPLSESLMMFSDLRELSIIRNHCQVELALDEILCVIRECMLSVCRQRRALNGKLSNGCNYQDDGTSGLGSDDDLLEDEDIMFDHRSSLEQLDADLGLDADSVRSLPLANVHQRRKSPRLYPAS